MTHDTTISNGLPLISKFCSLRIISGNVLVLPDSHIFVYSWKVVLPHFTDLALPNVLRLEKAIGIMQNTVSDIIQHKHKVLSERKGWILHYVPHVFKYVYTEKTSITNAVV